MIGRVWKLAPVALLPLAACGPSSASERRADEDRCRDEGNVVLYADPTDNWGDTMMIGCVTPREYAEMFTTYTKIEETSDN